MLPPPPPLHDARLRAAPHLQGWRTPLPSVLIHGGALVLWGVLFCMAFAVGGVLAWSVGVVYVVYDTVLLAFVGWRTWDLLRPAAAAAAVPMAGAAAPAAMRTSVCVLVAAHNEAGALPLTIAALLGQTDPPEQIMVVDDGSTDGTADLLVRHYGLALPAPGTVGLPSIAYPTLRWLALPHGGKALALNAALPRAGTDVVLTVDGDTLLAPTALAAMRQAFAAEPGLVAATGVIVPVCGPSFSGRVFQWFQTYEYIRNFLSRHAWMRMDSLLLVSGAFAGYRRSALLAVGGFDPDSMVEDYELTHRLRRHAVAHGLPWTVRVLGTACARTDAPSSIGAFLNQRRRWFGGFLQTQWLYRDMVGNRRYGWLGLLMLPVKAFDTLQPLYGLTAFFLLAYYLAAGRLSLLGAAASVIGLKLAIDLAFHLWSIRLYRRWVGDTAPASLAQGLLAALAEPFTFQLLRHTGAALGWVSFLTRRRRWGVQRRVGVVAPRRDGDVS